MSALDESVLAPLGGHDATPEKRAEIDDLMHLELGTAAVLQGLRTTESGLYRNLAAGHQIVTPKN